MQQLDNHDFCDTSFTDVTLHTLCKEALDGLFKQGLQNSMSYMFNEVLKQHLHFNQLSKVKTPSDLYLKSEISQPSMIDIVDAKNLILNQVFGQLKSASMESVINYIQGLL